MDLKSVLSTATTKLTRAGIATARLDILVLLEDITKKDRSWLLAHPEFVLNKAQQKKLHDFVLRRITHEPIAYLRQKTEFYGREFYIDHRVLEPRPESEAMIDLLKQYPLPENPSVLDVGTGSGMLAITVKLEFPQARVIASDIDTNCLAVAQKNAASFKTDITFLQGNLLTPIQAANEKPIAILANLPYVPDSFQINPAAMAEPRIAIFGGSDGLYLYRKLFAQLRSWGHKPLYLVTESMPPQHQALAKIAKTAMYSLAQTDGFIQFFRKD